MSIRFDRQVAIVTGAGGGLGRAYALELARRGARIAVVDPGGTRDGSGGSDMAQTVADEITAEGGEAIADRGSVASEADMGALIKRVRAAWGRVDILINNAGILRDRSFAKMTVEEWRQVLDVHLTGSAIATRAVWTLMREQGHGRVLMTTSSAGLYGNFGQANYAAAKLGLVGLTKTLAIEGERYGIRVNALAPLAATRMSEDVFPPEALELFRAEAVIPAALFLVSEGAPTGAVLAAGGGHYHVAQITMSRGEILPRNRWTPEDIAASWSKIADPADQAVPRSSLEHFSAVARTLVK